MRCLCHAPSAHPCLPATAAARQLLQGCCGAVPYMQESSNRSPRPSRTSTASSLLASGLSPATMPKQVCPNCTAEPHACRNLRQPACWDRDAAALGLHSSSVMCVLLTTGAASGAKGVRYNGGKLTMAGDGAPGPLALGGAGSSSTQSGACAQCMAACSTSSTLQAAQGRTANWWPPGR